MSDKTTPTLAAPESALAKKLESARDIIYDVACELRRASLPPPASSEDTAVATVETPPRECTCPAGAPEPVCDYCTGGPHRCGAYTVPGPAVQCLLQDGHDGDHDFPDPSAPNRERDHETAALLTDLRDAARPDAPAARKHRACVAALAYLERLASPPPDVAPLVAELRRLRVSHMNIRHRRLMQRAADALERLAAERDASVAAERAVARRDKEYLGGRIGDLRAKLSQAELMRDSHFKAFSDMKARAEAAEAKLAQREAMLEEAIRSANVGIDRAIAAESRLAALSAPAEEGPAVWVLFDSCGDPCHVFDNERESKGAGNVVPYIPASVAEGPRAKLAANDRLLSDALSDLSRLKDGVVMGTVRGVDEKATRARHVELEDFMPQGASVEVRAVGKGE